jgi:hypothetical protein
LIIFYICGVKTNPIQTHKPVMIRHTEATPIATRIADGLFMAIAQGNDKLQIKYANIRV